jgi:hypothetical protein
MKKYWIIFSVLGALALIAYLTQSNSTLRGREAQLAYPDTLDANRIRLIYRDTLEIQKHENTWKTSEYVVRPAAIKLALSALASLKVASPLSSIEKNQVNEMLDKGIRVELYKDEKLLRAWYFADDSTTQRTFVRRADVNKAYITQIEGFNGRITSIFTTSTARWRSSKVLPFSVNEIKTITVTAGADSAHKFTIECAGNKMRLLNQKLAPQPFDAALLTGFVTNLSELRFEGVLKEFSNEKMIWLNSQTAKTSWNITGYSNKTVSLRLYPIPLDDKFSQFDLNKAYLKIGNDKYPVIVRYKDTDPLSIGIEQLKR